MSEADASSGNASESVQISSEVKKRLQEYSRQHNQPLGRTLDKVIRVYVQRRLSKEGR
ncbi:MAG: hypothetical protein WCH86_08105 [Kiritimatiellales bacterium]